MTTPDILLLAAAIVPIMLARSTTSMSLPHNQTEGTRMKRLDSLLQEEVGQAIIAECDMPLGTLASVTRVETSPDVAHARVFVSVLPEEQSLEVMATLEENIYDLQQILNKRLHLKKVPRIEFFLDRSESHAARVNELIEEERRAHHEHDAK